MLHYNLDYLMLWDFTEAWRSILCIPAFCKYGSKGLGMLSEVYRIRIPILLYIIISLNRNKPFFVLFSLVRPQPFVPNETPCVTCKHMSAIYKTESNPLQVLLAFHVARLRETIWTMLVYKSRSDLSFSKPSLSAWLTLLNFFFLIYLLASLFRN